MTTPRMVYCVLAKCVRYWGPLFGPFVDPVFACEAFPTGIPKIILSGDNKHTEPVDGDGGLVFEPTDVGEKGGPGSGNFGHAGRPGLVDGSGGLVFEPADGTGVDLSLLNGGEL